MRLLILFSFLLISIFSKAQEINLPQRQIQVFAGKSFNGTGDINGFAFKTEFGQYIKKKSAWYIGIGGTIHDKDGPIFTPIPQAHK